jgi:hypothetical protein
MANAMRLAISSCLLASAFLAAPGARAQSLQSEQVQGNRRICYYGGTNGILSGPAQTSQYAVGVGENCPVTPPLDNSDRPAPPTALLRSDSPSPTGGRVCVYEQWASRWTFNLSGRTACPPAAGMIARDRRLGPEPGRTAPPAR